MSLNLRPTKRRGQSSAVRTAKTPSMFFAAAVSMLRMRAWA
jgi:hypothetical protein